MRFPAMGMQVFSLPAPHGSDEVLHVPADFQGLELLHFLSVEIERGNVALPIVHPAMLAFNNHRNTTAAREPVRAVHVLSPQVRSLIILSFGQTSGLKEKDYQGAALWGKNMDSPDWFPGGS